MAKKIEYKYFGSRRDNNLSNFFKSYTSAVDVRINEVKKAESKALEKQKDMRFH